MEALDWHPDGEYKKVPLLLEANPNGLIPTIIGPDKRVVNESLVCIEFADDLASVGVGDPDVRLLPADPYDRARCRVQGGWGDRAAALTQPAAIIAGATAACRRCRRAQIRRLYSPPINRPPNECHLRHRQRTG